MRKNHSHVQPKLFVEQFELWKDITYLGKKEEEEMTNVNGDFFKFNDIITDKQK